MSKKLKKNKKYTGYIVLLWIIYLIPMLFLAIVFISAATGKLGEMPSIEQLENPKTNLATAIYSSDGVVLGKFYLNDNRTPISFSELPKNIMVNLRFGILKWPVGCLDGRVIQISEFLKRVRVAWFRISDLGGSLLGILYCLIPISESRFRIAERVFPKWDFRSLDRRFLFSEKRYRKEEEGNGKCPPDER